MQKELQKETQKADGAEEGQESAVTILAEALAEAEGQFEITAKFYAPCVSCGDRTEIYCDIIDHDPDMHYCGKDPRCCP